MSFARKVKEEIGKIERDECCIESEFIAMLKLGAEIELSSRGTCIVYTTANASIARRFVYLLKHLFTNEVELVTKRETKLNKRLFYVVRVIASNDLIKKYDLLGDKEFEFEKTCCNTAYLAAAFMTCGSINDPLKGAHLEFYSSDESHLENLQKILNKYKIKSKITFRRSGYILYMKTVESIESILLNIGATSSFYEFVEERIVRDHRNSETRLANCEIANMTKAMEAANKQIEYIKIIEGSTRSVKDNLKFVMELRKENTEATLVELCEIAKEEHGVELSKSTLNHRFRAIKKLSEEITDSRGKVT